MLTSKSATRAAFVFASLLLLNASLTFGNVWPTPAIRWQPQLSVELAATLLLVAVFKDRIVTAIAAIWIVLVFGHYADVTAPALYGRDVNLYWDLRLIPDVVAMVTRVAPVWLIVVCAAAIGAAIAGLFAASRWAWRQVAAAMRDVRMRPVLVGLGGLLLLLFIGDRAREPEPDTLPLFAAPVLETYGRQARLIVRAVAAPDTLPPSPSMTSDFSRVRGADVFLVFVESYGAVAFDRDDFNGGLAASRAVLQRAIDDTGRSVASAFVESPTFGGGSWLAHISFISGVDVREPDTNAMLMTQQRDTFVRAMARAGFRTVALMPGLRQSWPEGEFYGFDEIYGADRLDYHGPEFGWFAIPDQYSLERFDRLEAPHEDRAPLFVFFPTISTHFPFSPTPPYQPEWPRMLSARPYDGPAIVRAYAHEPDWTDFGPGYIEALSYDLTTLAGYLQLHRDRDLVMIVIGDHQPAAAVSGAHASWDVPVHVIANRRDIVEQFTAHGFRSGLTPQRPSLGKMHELLPIVLTAFGERRHETGTERRTEPERP